MKKMIKKIFIICFALIMTLSIEAQAASVEDYMNSGITAYQKGDYEKAADNFTYAIAGEPEVYGLYAVRAKCYMQMKNYQGVIEDCSEIIELHPDDNKTLGMAYYMRASAMMETKGPNMIKIARDLKKAIQNDKYLFDAYDAMAAMLVSIGKYDTSIELMNTAIAAAEEINDKNAIQNIRNNIGEIKEIQAKNKK